MALNRWVGCDGWVDGWMDQITENTLYTYHHPIYLIPTWRFAHRSHALPLIP